MTTSEQEVAGLVLNYEQAGEQHRRVYIFGLQGLSLCLFREQKSLKFIQLPDFLDELVCQLRPSQSTTGLPFVKEYKIVSSNRELSRDAHSFLTVSRIARFYLDNGSHLLDPAPHYLLLQKAIRSTVHASSKNLVLLKVYFEFARKEGLPVREAWLGSLPKDQARVAETWLSLPIKDAQVEQGVLMFLLDSLKNWMNGETELQV